MNSRQLDILRLKITIVVGIITLSIMGFYYFKSKPLAKNERLAAQVIKNISPDTYRVRDYSKNI